MMTIQYYKLIEKIWVWENASFSNFDKIHIFKFYLKLNKKSYGLLEIKDIKSIDVAVKCEMGKFQD